LSSIKYKYLIFYKPYGVICQFTDEKSTIKRPTLKDYIPVSGIYSVGRLDLDSEGLLLLTDDNVVKYHLGERQFAHKRSYWVQVEGIPTPSALQQLSQGVIIKGEKTRPALVKILEQEPPLPPRNPPIR